MYKKTRKYIPQSAFWTSWLFIELTNRNDKVCLTLDYSGINKDGPGRFRTEADKLEFQTCYFNVANDEQSYNEFVSQSINSSKTDDSIQFKIINLKSKTNSDKTFDATKEFCDLNKNNGTGASGNNKKKLEQSLERSVEIQNPLNSLVQELNHELELSQDFFLDDNVDCGQQQQHFIAKKQYIRLSRRKQKK